MDTELMGLLIQSAAIFAIQNFDAFIKAVDEADDKGASLTNDDAMQKVVMHHLYLLSVNRSVPIPVSLS